MTVAVEKDLKVKNQPLLYSNASLQPLCCLNIVVIIMFLAQA